MHFLESFPIPGMIIPYVEEHFKPGKSIKFVLDKSDTNLGFQIDDKVCLLIHLKEDSPTRTGQYSFIIGTVSLTFTLEAIEKNNEWILNLNYPS